MADITEITSAVFHYSIVGGHENGDGWDLLILWICNEASQTFQGMLIS